MHFITPYVLDSIDGVEGVIDSAVLSNAHDLQKKKLEADYLLIFMGLKTSANSLMGQLEHEKGRIKVDPSTSLSNLGGIYAVGDASTYYNKVKLSLDGFSESSLALHHAYDRVFDGKSYTANILLTEVI